MLSLSETQLRWARLRGSGLIEPFASPEAAASALVGVQAQIVPAAALALWNRVPAFSLSAFERALYKERTLVKFAGQRSTLHLYDARDWSTVHAGFHNYPTGWRRWWTRQGKLDVYEAVSEQAGRLLRERGVIGRSDARAAGIDDIHLSGWGGVFEELVRRGLACHADPAGGEARVAWREHWRPDLAWEPPVQPAAAAELARRYLRAFAPATVNDLAYWGGRYVADARAALAALGNEVSEVEAGGRTLLALTETLDQLAQTPPEPKAWPIRMLFRFDPLLLGHKEKAWIVGEKDYTKVWRPAGHIEGTLVVEGRVAATWGYERKTSGVRITVCPFGRMTAKVQKAVERGAEGVAAFFGAELSGLEVGD